MGPMANWGCGMEGNGRPPVSTEELCKAIGEVIRARRKYLRFTLAQVADRTGVSLGYISQIELGRNTPSIDILNTISYCLGIHLHELFHTVFWHMKQPEVPIGVRQDE